jgi:hypothetical protein
VNDLVEVVLVHEPGEGTVSSGRDVDDVEQSVLLETDGGIRVELRANLLAAVR